MKQLTALLAALTFALAPLAANAGLIRDAEIEHTLQLYSRPIFNAAGITPEDVRILIVDNPAINAYVAGGLNIFLHTGLILATTEPGMLIGVIAHETGHISGAHLSQFRDKSTRAAIGQAIGALLGVAAIAGGAKQAGAGVLAGSQNLVQKNFLSEIRVNESSADQAALTFLDASDMSASGMLSMFEVLRSRESGGTARDPFLTDHPLTPERIATVRNHANESKIPTGQVPDSFPALHARMIAKLIAFTSTYDETLNRYPLSDSSVAARYARAIAEYRRNAIDAALAGLNSLIKQHPKDPYFYDTKGQILFEHGRLLDAATAYAKATTLAPDSALILTDYAKTLIAEDKPAEMLRAVALLERSRDLDDSYDVTWRQLAIAYGKQGKLGASYEALAEEAALGGDYKTVLQHVARARDDAKSDPQLQLQLDDLEREAKEQLGQQKQRDSLF
ncbi:MAG: M48 family metalloprotease [Rickettsiales bacterium]